jgi:UDP-N-acetyl-D-mannosaminuronic acid transferase (WecB/TagA/CpsF family)
MQKTYLEWLFRLPQQPKKTAFRMLLVPRFILRTIMHGLKDKDYGVRIKK